MKKDIPVCVTILASILIFLSCTSQKPSEDWISLFNGKNLEGWIIHSTEKDKDKTFWSVEDGVIVCDSMGRKDHDYVWLISQDEFDDFELRLKFQAFRDSPGNSGIQVRSRYDASPEGIDHGWMNGPQVDIHPPTPWRTGLIYDETWEERRWIFPSLKDWNIDDSYAPENWRFYWVNGEDAWNDLEITCKGTGIKTALNGFVMADYDGSGVLDNAAHKKRNVGLKGYIAMQLHSNDELHIRFKEIYIRKLAGN